MDLDGHDRALPHAAAGMGPPPPPKLGGVASGTPVGPTSSSLVLPTLLPIARGGGGGNRPGHPPGPEDADAGVRATNDDAQVSKL